MRHHKIATETIQIQITERGSRRVVVNINQIGNSSERAAQRSNLLRQALGLLGGAAVLRGLTRTADEITNIENRLKLVTDDASNLTTVFDELVGVSNRTRTSFRDNAELFTRTALATRELGLSQKRVIGFTESLAQAVILSGASAQESSNAIRQLSQGLQNGALRGEEFRSVSEQLPLVLEVIADDLGITRGRLREMAFEGELTAELIVGAFERAAPRLRDTFGETVPTIGQSFTVLGNSFLSFFAELNKSTRFSEAFANTILFLAENIEYLARFAITVGLVGALSLAISTLNRLAIAAAANPFTALAVAITAIIGLLVAFQDEIFITNDGLTTLGDFFAATFDVLTETVPQVLSAIQGMFQPFLQQLGFLGTDTETTLFDVLRIGALFIDSFAGLFVGLGNALRIVFANPLDTIKALFVAAINSIVEVLEFLSDSITSIFFAIGKSFSAFGTRLGIALNLIGAALEQIQLGNLSGAADFIDEALFQIVNSTGQLVTGFGDNVAKEFDRLREEDVLKRIEGPLAQDALDLGQAVGSAIVDGIQNTTGATDLVNAIDIRTGIIAQQRVIDDTRKEIERQQQRDRLDTIVGGGASDRRVSSEAEARSVFDGFSRGFSQLRDEITDFASLSENLLVNAFGSAEDALVEFVKTGEFNFSGFIDSVLSDLTRLLARQALFGLLAGFGAPGFSFGQFGGLGGFLFGGARAEGGPVTSGQAFLVGERGPELFVPPSSGTIAPNDSLGGSPVNVTVVNVRDESEIAAYLNSAEGGEVIINQMLSQPERVKAGLGVS